MPPLVAADGRLRDAVEDVPFRCRVVDAPLPLEANVLELGDLPPPTEVELAEIAIIIVLKDASPL